MDTIENYRTKAFALNSKKCNTEIKGNYLVLWLILFLALTRFYCSLNVPNYKFIKLFWKKMPAVPKIDLKMAKLAYHIT